ncbi:MAG: hypothetical protein JWR26_3682 [Pedosphaera sp.]|nr:hypothetical protein [Pedosphaera sp.]
MTPYFQPSDKQVNEWFYRRHAPAPLGGRARAPRPGTVVAVCMVAVRKDPVCPQAALPFAEECERLVRMVAVRKDLDLAQRPRKTRRQPRIAASPSPRWPCASTPAGGTPQKKKNIKYTPGQSGTIRDNLGHCATWACPFHCIRHLHAPPIVIMPVPRSSGFCAAGAVCEHQGHKKTRMI